MLPLIVTTHKNRVKNQRKKGMKNLKQLRKDFQSLGQFYTEDKCANYLASFFEGRDVKEIYDPTCGTGNLFVPFTNAKIYGQELQEQAVRECQEKFPNATLYAGDVLGELKFTKGRFDNIISNYPFSVAWNGPLEADPRFEGYPTIPTNSKADFAFFAHILYLLSDQGLAVVQAFPGVLYRGAREGKIRQYLIEQNYIEKIVSIPPKQFADTNISTCVIVFRKDKPNTDITFINLDQNWAETSHTVTLEEVRANDYSLSPSIYTIKEADTPKVSKEDFIKVNEDIRGVMVRHLETGLRQDKLTDELNVEMGIYPTHTHEAFKARLIETIQNIRY